MRGRVHRLGRGVPGAGKSERRPDDADSGESDRQAGAMPTHPDPGAPGGGETEPGRPGQATGAVSVVRGHEKVPATQRIDEDTEFVITTRTRTVEARDCRTNSDVLVSRTCGPSRVGAV